VRRALAIRHFDAGGLGNIEPVLAEHGYDVTVIDASGPAVRAAALEHWDLVIVLGSEDAVYEDHDYVGPEIELVRQRLDREEPTLGVCFGAQIMAAALGGSVYKGASGAEIGFAAVEPTALGRESPLRRFAGVPVCEWHGDTFSLPVSVTPLASTPAYGNQAFAVGRTALAVQFHPEVTPEMFERWVAEGIGDLAANDVDPAQLRADAVARLSAAGEASRRMFSEFLDGLPDGDPGAPATRTVPDLGRSDQGA
jgi:GMP synthase (glutamine-hydrolysing)